MKTIHLFFLAAALFLGACKDDEDNILQDGQTYLKLDGDNFSGPLLDTGNYEMAVRFPASELAEHAGEKLTEVHFFVGDKFPEDAQVRIYGKGTDSTPGALLYEKDVTNALKNLAWNEHPVSPVLTLDGEDIWLSIAFTHAEKQQSIGCDAGPNKSGGDWLFDSNDGEWKTYLVRSAESVNWNIRGVIEK